MDLNASLQPLLAELTADPDPKAVIRRGDRVGITSEPVLAGLSSVRGPLTVHEYTCILRFEGCPVFLMANDKQVAFNGSLSHD